MFLALPQVPYRLDILRIEGRVCASPLVTPHNVLLTRQLYAGNPGLM